MEVDNIFGDVAKYGSRKRALGTRIGTTVNHLGRTSAAAGGATMRGGIKGGNFASRHKGVIIGGAAVAGVIAAHPLGNAENALYGDPHHFSKTFGGAIAGNFPMIQGQGPGFGANITSDETTAGITSEGGGFSINPDPDQALRMSEGNGANPNGSLVFGLYSNRLR